ncbi:MAG: serine/threonine-protein phosphatase [Phycisphaeraceae bacterium]|nr:serine/threonine-protein phosphatase [Phycisphaeraceae bacterium]
MRDGHSMSPSLELSQREMDEARLGLLRQRVASFGTVVGLLLILLAGIQWWLRSSVLPEPDTRAGRAWVIVGLATGVAIIVLPRIRKRRLQQLTLRALVWRTIWIVTMAALSQGQGTEDLSKGADRAMHALGLGVHVSPIVALAGFMVLLHSAAAIIVPWTVLEACLPPIAWAALAPLVSSGSRDLGGSVALGLSLPLLAGIPGVAVTVLRAGRLRETLGLRMAGARYAEVERELAMARRLHERLFPAPVRTGPIRLEYAYEPMRQIGGDFLDLVRGRDGSLLVIMIDVTGHGVAAALAVNRLHGEIKRLLAESESAAPSELVRALNRYVHLTLADESVFATAAAARIWPDGCARLCIAGHPPPMLRATDGSVSTIRPTAAILGPFAPGEYEADEVEARIGPGAVLVLYTDGAIEGRDANGRLLGEDALRWVLDEVPAPGSIPAAALQRISMRRVGAAEDDVLIATISTTPAEIPGDCRS